MDKTVFQQNPAATAKLEGIYYAKFSAKSKLPESYRYLILLPNGKARLASSDVTPATVQEAADFDPYWDGDYTLRNGKLILEFVPTAPDAAVIKGFALVWGDSLQLTSNVTFIEGEKKRVVFRRIRKKS